MTKHVVINNKPINSRNNLCIMNLPRLHGEVTKD